MSAESVCDGCGKRAPMSNYNGKWFRPHGWFERSDEDGCQTACSRECIAKIAEKTGKTSVVAPL